MLLFFLQLASGNLCGSFQCSNFALNSTNQCREQIGMTFNLAVCSQYYYTYCEQGYDDAYCTLPPIESDVDIALPGESCIYDRNCQNSLCNNGTCNGNSTGGICIDSSACNPGFYCGINNTCVNLGNEGAACESDFECTNNLGCFNKSCRGYFTLTEGTIVDSCANGVNFMCQNGGCYQMNNNSLACLGNEKSEKALPVACQSNDDCIINGTVLYSTGCTCGYNAEASAFCNLAPGDEPFSIFINYIKNWTSTSITKCHTYARFSQTCMGDILSTTSGFYVNMTYWQELALNYPLIQNNDPCVQEIYTSSYWAAKSAYDGQNVMPDHSYSQWLALSIILIEMI